MMWSLVLGIALATDLPPACDGSDWEACLDAIRELEDPSVRVEAMVVACAEGQQGRACRSLGYATADGRLGLSRDTAEALRWFDQGCRLNDASSCLQVGLSTSYGFAGSLDYGRAAAAYERACELEQPIACNNLGVLHRRGQGFPANKRKAAAYYDLGCGTGSSVACDNLAAVLPAGSFPATEAEQRAVALLEERCRGGSTDMCIDLAQRRYQGDGVPRQRQRALDTLTELCEGSPATPYACTIRTRLQIEDLPPDTWSADHLDELEHACGLESAEACRLLGVYAERTGELVEAASFFEQSCALGQARACELFGDMHLLRRIPNADPARSIEPLWTACLGLRSGGCQSLSMALDVHSGDHGAPKGTASALARAVCERGSGCNAYVLRLRHGVDGAPEPERAMEVATTACQEEDDVFACLQAARMAEDHQQNLEQALGYLEHACDDLRSPLGCGGYGKALRRSGQLGMARDALQEACKGGDPAGCGELAELFALGEGAPQRPERAKLLRTQACALGHVPSCMAGWMADEGVP